MARTFRRVHRKSVGGKSRRSSKTRSSSQRLRTLKQKYDSKSKSLFAAFNGKELNELKAAINKLEQSKSKSKSKEVGALKKIYNTISSNPGTTFGTVGALLGTALVARGDISSENFKPIADFVRRKRQIYMPTDAENDLARKIQAPARGFTAKSSYKKKRKAAIKLQALGRGVQGRDPSVKPKAALDRLAAHLAAEKQKN